MTPSLRFLRDSTVAYVALVAVVDLAYALGWLPGGTITRGIEGLATRYPWLPSAYVAGALGLVAAGYWHFFGRR